MVAYKSVKALKILVSGLPIAFEDRLYIFDEEYNLCQECDVFENGSKEPTGKCLVKVSFGNVKISDFIRWADRIPDDIIAERLSILALKNMQKKESR